MQKHEPGSARFIRKDADTGKKTLSAVTLSTADSKNQCSRRLLQDKESSIKLIFLRLNIAYLDIIKPHNVFMLQLL